MDSIFSMAVLIHFSSLFLDCVYFCFCSFNANHVQFPWVLCVFVGLSLWLLRQKALTTGRGSWYGQKNFLCNYCDFLIYKCCICCEWCMLVCEGYSM